MTSFVKGESLEETILDDDHVAFFQNHVAILTGENASQIDFENVLLSRSGQALDLNVVFEARSLSPPARAIARRRVASLPAGNL